MTTGQDKNSSSTPRTDAFAAGRPHHPLKDWPNFARQLERELASSLEDRQALNDMVTGLQRIIEEDLAGVPSSPANQEPVGEVLGREGTRRALVKWYDKELLPIGTKLYLAPSVVTRDEIIKECARVAYRMQEAAAAVLATDHDDDAAVQHDTAVEIAKSILALKSAHTPAATEKQISPTWYSPDTLLVSLDKHHEAFIKGTGRDPANYSSIYSEASTFIRDLLKATAPTPSASATKEIEDALWTLHSYESNRDDAGRSYSEEAITRMVKTVRSMPSRNEIPEGRRSSPAGALVSGSPIQAVPDENPGSAVPGGGSAGVAPTTGPADYQAAADYLRGSALALKGVTPEAIQAVQDYYIDRFESMARTVFPAPAPAPTTERKNGDIEKVRALVSTFGHYRMIGDDVAAGGVFADIAIGLDKIQAAISCAPSATPRADFDADHWLSIKDATAVLVIVEWLQRWWKRDAAWRNEQRAQLGPDVAQLMRGVADMIEQPCERPVDMRNENAP